MLEIHLFINPLAKSCLFSERDILQISQQKSVKINYQFVPLVNMKTIQDTMQAVNNSLASYSRNQIAQRQYQMAIDYKAALCQGGLRGRKFLLALQTAILNQQITYDDQLVKKIADKVGLDWCEFLADRKSPNTKKYFLQDQKLADKLGVKQVGSAVICDTDDAEYAVLIDNFCLKSFLNYFNRNKSLRPEKRPSSKGQASIPHLNL